MKLWMILLLSEDLGNVNPKLEIYMYMCGMRLLMMLMTLRWDCVVMIILIWDDVDVDGYDNIDMKWCWFKKFKDFLDYQL